MILLFLLMVLVLIFIFLLFLLVLFFFTFVCYHECHHCYCCCFCGVIVIRINAFHILGTVVITKVVPRGSLYYLLYGIAKSLILLITVRPLSSMALFPLSVPCCCPQLPLPPVPVFTNTWHQRFSVNDAAPKP